jgi:hypothetical protein
MLYVKVNESGTVGQNTVPKNIMFSHREVGIFNNRWDVIFPLK